MPIEIVSTVGAVGKAVRLFHDLMRPASKHAGNNRHRKASEIDPEILRENKNEGADLGEDPEAGVLKSFHHLEDIERTIATVLKIRDAQINRNLAGLCCHCHFINSIIIAS